MSKLPIQLKVGREEGVMGPLRLPGMMRESSTRQLKTNLGQTQTKEKRPVPKPKNAAIKGLGSASAPHKHQMGLIDPSKIKFGFGGPGSTEPV